MCAWLCRSISSLWLKNQHSSDCFMMRLGYLVTYVTIGLPHSEKAIMTAHSEFSCRSGRARKLYPTVSGAMIPSFFWLLAFSLRLSFFSRFLLLRFSTINAAFSASARRATFSRSFRACVFVLMAILLFFPGRFLFVVCVSSNEIVTAFACSCEESVTVVTRQGSLQPD